MTQLNYLEEIIGLDIIPIQSLLDIWRSFKDYKPNLWVESEEKIKKEYGAPSLTAFLLFEHQFRGKSLRVLASILGTSHQNISNLMKRTGIPTRSENDSYVIAEKDDTKVYEGMNLSIYNI